MTFTPHGRHLIAGDWVAAETTFSSQPASGLAHAFSAGSPAHVDAACRGAEAAFASFAALHRAERAGFLETIADKIEARAEAVTQIGHEETGLPKARLEAEGGRTTGQLRLFAAHIRAGEHLDRRHSPAQPERKPAPRPDLKLVQRPMGPVAVFGASNFPLAFSVAGGDTASALAAGCPVVVKGHSAHPGTGEIVAEAIHAAIAASGVHPGVFSLVQGGQREVGEALVRHPLIKAVGFTGSLAGGRALFNLCAARPEPIPFYGELGSINPMFLLPQALSARSGSIAAGWIASLTLGAGQFCTNPGIVVLVDGPDADAFVTAAREAVDAVDAQIMLTDGIATAYRQGRQRIAKQLGVREILATDFDGRMAGPCLFEVAGEDWLGNHVLAEEVFGPLGLILRVRDEKQMLEIAGMLQGQLTCALHLDDADLPLAERLTPILERKAGRLLANGFPTGVEVVDAQVHGGPYPASTNFGATSVGTLAIRRWLRPVAYQNMPHALVPKEYW